MLQRKVFSVCFSLLLIAASLPAQDYKTIDQEFDGVKKVRMKFVSGDCIVKKASGEKVRVQLRYVDDDGNMEPELRMSGSTLRLSEHYNRSSWRRHHNDKAVWTVSVPANMKVQFSAASGNFSCSNIDLDLKGSTASGDFQIETYKGEAEISTASGEVELRNFNGMMEISTASGELDVIDSSGEVDASTASGNISIRRSNGQFDLSAASGDIDVSTARGEFKVSVASGNIRADDFVLTGASEFKTASGDVDLRLGASAAHDLEAAAASGNVALNYKNHKIVGMFELTARNRSGSMRAPFDFDSEEIHSGWGDKEHVTRYSKQGGADAPLVSLRSASGRVALRAN